MLGWIVDQCHVGDDYGTVRRHVVSRLRDGYDTFASWPRAKRRSFLRALHRRHKDNRALYRSVMRGF